MSDLTSSMKFKNTGAMQNVSKRDGTLAPFDAVKIYNAILKAGNTTGELNEKKARNLTEKVLLEIELVSDEKNVISIEEIQDLVEKGLMSTKRKDVAKNYILYREERTKVRNANSKLMQNIKENFKIN